MNIASTLHVLAAAPAQPQASPLQSFVFMAAIVAIMWFFLFLPQQRERKKHDLLISGMKKDDKVVLLNGIHGVIFRVNDNTFVVEIADRTRVTIDKTAVARKSGADAASEK